MNQYLSLDSTKFPHALLLLVDTGQVDAGGHPIVKLAVDSGSTSSSSGSSTVNQGTPGTPWPTTDAGPYWTTSRGLSGLPFQTATGTSAQSVTDAPTSGQKLVITDLVISVDTTMTVTFKEQTSGTIVAGPYYIAANSVVQITPRSKFKLPTANRTLQVVTSVAGMITVSAYYFSEA